MTREGYSKSMSSYSRYLQTVDEHQRQGAPAPDPTRVFAARRSAKHLTLRELHGLLPELTTDQLRTLIYEGAFGRVKKQRGVWRIPREVAVAFVESRRTNPK